MFAIARCQPRSLKSLPRGQGSATIKRDEAGGATQGGRVTDGVDARRLLTLMREPSRTIKHVHETCDIAIGEMTRNVRLTLDFGDTDVEPDGQRVKKRSAKFKEVLVDVAHPRRGTVSDVAIAGNDVDARRLTHVEHLELARDLIAYRFAYLFNKTSVPQRDALAFTGAMYFVLRDLLSIPDDADRGGESARQIMERVFDPETKQLRVFGEFGEARFSPSIGTSLYWLCHELSRNYLLVYRCQPPRKGRHLDITFSIRHAVRDLPPSRSASRFLGSQARSAARKLFPRTFDRHAKTATLPVAFLIHCPWARRTKHYELTVDSPSGHFFANQVVLEDDENREPGAQGADGLRVLTGAQANPVDWSIETGQGRRMHAYIGNGAEHERPIYVGILNLELPGRMTTRAFFIALLAFSSYIALWGVKAIVDNPESLATIAAIIAAMIAVGSFGFLPAPQEGVLGTPLLARFSMTATAFLATAYAVWFVSGQVVMPDDGSWRRQLLALAWNTWADFGGLAIIACAGFLLVRLTFRRHQLIHHFARASRERHAIMPRFGNGAE